MNRKRALAIKTAFDAADDATNGKKSTEYLIAIVADQCRCEYHDVVEALAITADGVENSK